MIILGDCVEVLKTFDAECIDLIVTSPPYDNLRSYGNTLDWEFKPLAAELKRVLRTGGGY
jgi:DNA modification methylase